MSKTLSNSKQADAQAYFDSLPGFEVKAEDIDVLNSPKEYHQKILELIKKTKKRIYLSLLYIENDEAGNEILEKLFQKKEENSEIDIQLFIDHHRAQRGRSDHPKDNGILPVIEALKKDIPEEKQLSVTTVQIVKTEGKGVFHPKGMVFDDTLLYSGASISNKYCHVGDELRLDTYVLFENTPKLANSFVEQMQVDFRANAGKILDSLEGFSSPEKTERNEDSVLVTPLIGKNSKSEVNEAMLNALKVAKEKITFYTPYFNLPEPLKEKIRETLNIGCKEQIVVGDKKANDWWLPPEQWKETTNNGFKDLNKFKFKSASMQLLGRTLPFFYEQQLKDFAKSFSKEIKDGLLKISLWKNGKNSTHTKRLEIDDKKIVILTGSNMNKRSWDTDLENAIVLQNLPQNLKKKFEKEQQSILENTETITSPEYIPNIKDYPRLARQGIRIFNVKQKKI